MVRLWPHPQGRLCPSGMARCCNNAWCRCAFGPISAPLFCSLFILGRFPVSVPAIFAARGKWGHTCASDLTCTPKPGPSAPLCLCFGTSLSISASALSQKAADQGLLAGMVMPWQVVADSRPLASNRLDVTPGQTMPQVVTQHALPGHHLQQHYPQQSSHGQAAIIRGFCSLGAFASGSPCALAETGST